MTDNELIAEFMGGQRSQRGQDTVFYFTPDFRGSGFWHIDYIPFDRSWDWLMPVVEKIETPDLIKGYNFSVEMLRRLEDNQVTIYSIVRDASFSMVNLWGRDVSKIKAVYKAVVEFIKWYNQNK